MVKYPIQSDLQKRIDDLKNYIAAADVEINDLKEGIRKANYEMNQLVKIVGEKNAK